MTLLSNGYTLLLLAMVVGTRRTDAQQYQHNERTYPDYCTTDLKHAQYEIPPLDRTSDIIKAPDSLQLRHVTAVIRHGARAPVAQHQCWPSYLNDDEDTSEWDCSLNTLTTTPSDTAIEVLKSKTLEFGENVQGPTDLDDVTFSSGNTPSFLYEKRYDANFSPSGSDHFPDNLGDHLQGTCQLGQLLLRGYEQQRQNGIILREAYVKDETKLLNTNRDMTELLYNFQDEADVNDAEGSRAYDEPRLYFRSDDDQRTIMSGQALLGEMFGDLMKVHSNKLQSTNKHNPVIRVHTSDRDRDFLSPNYDICPRLAEMEMEAMESDTYIEKFLTGDEARTMNDFADEYLGGSWRYDDPGVAMDCFMTTACTDRTLPFALDYDKSNENQNIRDRFGNDWIKRWTQFHTEKETFKYKHDNFKYSQIVTNPIWNDIMGGLLAFTNADKHEMAEAWPDLRDPSTLTLYSAHDTTLMALLSSLGPNVWDGTEWPAYASMFVIELYDINFDSYVPQDQKWEVEEQFPTKVAFRLLYNGEVLTNKISGCPPNEEICDLDILIIHVFRFSNVSEWDKQCEAMNPVIGDEDGIDLGEDEDGDEDEYYDQDYRDSRVPDAIFLLLGSAIVFGSAGAFAMYIYLTKDSMKHDQMHSLNSLNLQQEPDPELNHSPTVEMSPTRKDNYALTPQSDAIMT